MGGLLLYIHPRNIDIKGLLLRVAKLTTKQQLRIVVLLILITTLSACLQLGYVPPTPAIRSRQITGSDPPVQEIWRVSDALVPPKSRHEFAHLVQAPDKIVGEVYNPLGRDGRIIAFNTSTGKPEWSFQTLDINSIAADQERVYVARAGTPIKAYNLSDGQLIWSGPVLASRRSYFLQAQEGLLFNYFTGAIQQIKAQTGELLSESQEEKITNSPVVWRSQEFDLRHVRQHSSILVKIRRGTNEVEWYSPVDEDSHWIREFALLYNNKLVMAAGETDPDIYVVDFETGQRLWKKDERFVSNVAVAKGKVYALRDDARLLIFDLNSGAELGYIQFTSASTDTSSKIYWVGADEEGRIFAYFSDSRELFGLTTVTE